jgi:uracil phosphoribosyltransferase
MQINYLGNQHSVLHEFVAELRDVTIQHDRLRFRKNIERVGQIMAYEISKALSYEQKSIQTPLGHHQSYKLTEQPVLATILRAGLSMGCYRFLTKPIAHSSRLTVSIPMHIRLTLW